MCAARSAPVFLPRNVRVVMRNAPLARRRVIMLSDLLRDAAAAAAAPPQSEWYHRIDLDVATHLEEMNMPDNRADVGFARVKQFMQEELDRSHLDIRIEPVQDGDGFNTTFHVHVSCDVEDKGRTLDELGVDRDLVLPYMAADYCWKSWRLLHDEDVPLPENVCALRDLRQTLHDQLLSRIA
jgi:hypothetical protein